MTNKMHFTFMYRGIKQQEELFEKFMETQMWNWVRKNKKTKKDEVVRVQGALRPWKIAEYVIPEECMEELLSVLNVDQKTIGAKDTFMNKARLKVLRKITGTKPIPKKYKKIPSDKFIPTHGVSIHPIGIKKDDRGDMMGYEQELL